jgi:hypothetical protein
VLKDGLMVMDDSVPSAGLKGIWESVLRDGLGMTEGLALVDSGAVLINEDLKVVLMMDKKNHAGLALRQGTRVLNKVIFHHAQEVEYAKAERQ